MTAMDKYRNALDQINRATDHEIAEAMLSAELTKAKIRDVFKRGRRYPAALSGDGGKDR